MTEEKIRYKDWRLIHKIFIPTLYGMIAFGAVITTYNIKHKKNLIEPILGTITAGLVAPLYHINAIADAREKKQRQRD